MIRSGHVFPKIAFPTFKYQTPPPLRFQGESPLDTFEHVKPLEVGNSFSRAVLSYVVIAEALNYSVKDVTLLHPLGEAMGQVEERSLPDLNKPLSKQAYGESVDVRSLKRILLALSGNLMRKSENDDTLEITHGGPTSFEAARGIIDELEFEEDETSMLGLLLPEVILDHAQEKIIQILDLIPQAKQDEMVKRISQSAGSHPNFPNILGITGNSVRRVMTEVLGPDFDWQPLKELAQAFIDDPTCPPESWLIP